MDQLHGSVAITGHIDRVTGAFQAAGEEVLDSLFVLDDQDSHSFRLWTQCSIGAHF